LKRTQKKNGESPELLSAEIWEGKRTTDGKERCGTVKIWGVGTPERERRVVCQNCDKREKCQDGEKSTGREKGTTDTHKGWGVRETSTRWETVTRKDKTLRVWGGELKKRGYTRG